MTIHRYAAKRDTSEATIVSVLETAGCRVTRLAKPVDLAVRKDWWPRGVQLFLECKTPTKSGKPQKRTDQPQQEAFLASGGALKVWTWQQALAAVYVTELALHP